MTISAVASWIALATIVLALVASQSSTCDRRPAMAWAAAGMLACLLKIALIQQAPQWHNVPWDALKYQANAEAFYLHWRGFAVDPQAFDLSGYLSGLNVTHGPFWQPDSTSTYVGVFGTYEWLYAAYVAVWHFVADDGAKWAVWSHAALAGVFPAGAFLLARFAGSSPAGARLAALLMVLDPLTATNASWPLKDTLVGFLAVLALVTAARLRGRPHWSGVFLLAAVAGLLGGGRFVAYLAVGIALLLLAATLFTSGQRREGLAVAIGMCLSVPVLLALVAAPIRLAPEVTSKAVTARLHAQTHTLKAQRGEEGSDEAVIAWRLRLKEDPARAIVTSVARTLFAPYPWVMLTHGLSGTNYVELYYPGAIFWIACLPLIALGLAAGVRRPSAETLWMLALLAALWCAYTLFLGEWSTRQRVFMNPVFFAFAALGFDTLVRRRGQAGPGEIAAIPTQRKERI